MRVGLTGGVHDIPLLVETGQEHDFDAVIVVDVPETEQVRRLVDDRGWDAAQARSRIAAQATREQRREAATHVVDNSGTLQDLRAGLTEVLRRVRQRPEPGGAAP